MRRAFTHYFRNVWNIINSGYLTGNHPPTGSGRSVNFKRATGTVAAWYSRIFRCSYCCFELKQHRNETIPHFYRGPAETSDGSPVSARRSGGMKHVQQMWQQRAWQALLSWQANLAAIPGSILCVRLSTQWAELMVLFYQDPGLGRNRIQVGLFFFFFSSTRSHMWRQDKHA